MSSCKAERAGGNARARGAGEEWLQSSRDCCRWRLYRKTMGREYCDPAHSFALCAVAGQLPWLCPLWSHWMLILMAFCLAAWLNTSYACIIWSKVK